VKSVKARGALAVLSVIPFAGGCVAASTDYMPLSPGAKWSYQIEEAGTLYTSYEVKGQAYVGREKGWRIVSDLGESRMAWWNGMLRASMLSGTVFDPPLPLLVPAKAEPLPKKKGTSSTSARTTAPEKPKVKPIRWKGRAMRGAVWMEATGELVQQEAAKDDRDLAFSRSGGRGIRAYLTLTIQGETHETLTVYREGIGVVRQLIQRPSRPPMNLIYSSGGAAAE
jgi:hypothetical protein